MQDLFTFYQDRIDVHKDSLYVIKKRLLRSSTLRLVVFFSICAGIYFFYGQTKLLIALVLGGGALFLFLVARHGALQHKKNRLLALLQINETEIDVLNRNFHSLPDGDTFKSPGHYYSQDIDLFGVGSFYQYANRTVLPQGSITFAGLLLENSIVNIKTKQEAIAELARMSEWRQDFSATASLAQTETATDTIVKWLKSYQVFVPGSMKILPYIFSGASLLLFVVYFLGYVPESLVILWLFLGLGITALYMKKIKKLGTAASKMQSTFQQYNQLLQQIENTEFTSELLRSKKNAILSNNEKTSVVIKKFSKLLNSLDKNNHWLYLFFANGFLLRTMTHVYHIERWVEKHGKSVEKWFDTIAFFDAYNSLGNFAFNHPKYTYPILEGEKAVLKSIGAGHPLLPLEKSVLNDFEIKGEQFFIITGANMAGKSTFLRTVSLQIVMANVGLPVCAKQSWYSPIKLITSMRTTDSLTDDESYFFSELKRLKFIVNEIQKDRYFIVLDEILKGTNSTDKAKGSRKFVERLVASKSTGIIATHDLSLCEVAEELPEVKNHYFDAEIIDNELHFDYKFKNGICQNMNASFLLKKMGIVE
ncbi:DNA mismatch repair protein MutS [Aggregatimonas sangjinii]|uniref:DNA mismatch repair protein MutS n=1 Tax=Aggregatimonas sangjinii TaxID=2583587 RepID=A0A5B7SRQ9_9FLAO|nr:DNA mismatch repair protein MutS [Aggregatimonas sangjinii]QCX01296.1 DNA mismatch repair protein MutS [Aggregatimonas sangjinii]